MVQRCTKCGYPISDTEPIFPLVTHNVIKYYCQKCYNTPIRKRLTAKKKGDVESNAGL